MRERVCNNCGGKKYKEIGQNMVKCLFCGTIYVDEYANKEEEILIVHAYEKIRALKFDKAVDEFDKILAIYPKSHEAYYGRLQAKNKVVYFSNKEGNKRYPSFFGKEIPSYFEDEDFKKAIEFAPKEIADSYTDQAKYIDKLKNIWQESASKQKPYDVILNVKKENEISKNIEKVLKEKELNIFLRENAKSAKSGIEAYLFHAVQTAKTEILLIDDDDVLNDPKVKNLYERFLYRIKTKDRFPSSFIVVYDDKKIDIDVIKKNFPELEKYYKLSSENFLSDLAIYTKSACERNYNQEVKIEKKVVEQVAPAKKTKVDVVNVVPSDLGHYNIETIPLSDKNRMKLIFNSIKNGDFQTAETYINEEKLKNEKNGELYFATILCEKKIRDENEFFNNIGNFQDKENLEKILQYSSTSFANDFLNKWENLIISLNDVDIYLKYLDFLSAYNNTEREKFVSSAEALAIDSMNEELISKVEKCLPSEDVDAFTNFYFQLGQKSGDETYYQKVLQLDEGHVQSRFALFMKNFDTVEEILSYRDGTALENVLKYCDDKRRTGFVTDLIDIILEVVFYDTKKAEAQLDFYLSYINDDEVTKETLITIASTLQSQGFFSLAEKYITLAIKEDKENATLYWQLIQIKTHCKSESELPTTSVKISDMEDFKTMLNFANDSQAEKYTQIVASANTTTAQKVFRQETLDKVVLKEKLQEFLLRNNKLISEMDDKTSASYYKKQFTAFDGYFQKIEDANTFEQYFDVFNRLLLRLSCFNLTLDTSINVAKFALKKERLQTLEKESKKRDEKYLSTIEVANKEMRRKKVLFGVLELAPMLLVMLLLVLVVSAPHEMYLVFDQDVIIIATVLTIFLGVGNLIFNIVKKDSSKKWKIARLSIFIISLINLILLLLGLYFFPPTVEAKSGEELNKLVHNASYMNIVLNDDIDMSKVEWKATDFYGSIDGNGHKIVNLKLSNSDNNYALFDSFGGEIRNLTIELDDVNYEDVQNFGTIGIVNQGIVDNVDVVLDISIHSTKDDAFIGGLFAKNGDGKIKNSSSTFSLSLASVNNLKIGGLVGVFEKGYKHAEISKCQTEFTLHAVIDNALTVQGGLIGESLNTNLTISECTSNVNFLLMGKNSATLGGLVGYNESAIANCYAVGDINAIECDNALIGGLVGEMKKRGQEIEKSYSTVKTFKAGNNEGTFLFGFLVGRLTEGILKDCFAVGTGDELVAERGNGAIAPAPSNCELFDDFLSYTNKFNFSDEIWHFEEDMLPVLQCFLN